MIPYASFLYFGVALYVLLPTLLVRAVLGFSRTWILIASLFMVVVQYYPLFGPDTSTSATGTSATGTSAAPGDLSGTSGTAELAMVLAYAVYQWLAALGFLWVRPRINRSWPFYLGLLLALLPFAAGKFLPLLAPGTFIGFLGLSYVTFRSLDVIIGIQDRLIPSLPPWQFLGYLLFFPTISSGPIDRWRRFGEDWNRPRTQTDFLADLDQAVHRIFTGFLFKFILSALIQQYWLEPVAQETGFWSTVSFMYAATFNLFFDFAGYSHFAIGFSYLLGIHTPENFNNPLMAPNIREFWNRWHISLSWWLRDHVYMRFVLAAAKGKWFASRYLASYIGLFLSFGTMGLWHAMEQMQLGQPLKTHYIIYGLFHAVLMIGYEIFARWNKPRKWWGDTLPWRIAGILLTFHCFSFSLLIFFGRLY